MKTKAQLLRDLKNSIGKELVCDYHFISDRKDRKRIITAVQTNGIKTSNENGKSVFMDIPNAKNVEYNENTFSIYNDTDGKRELTSDEKREYERIMEVIKEHDNAITSSGMTYAERDIMADMNTCYYFDNEVWENSSISKLKGKITKENGKYFAKDNNVKGTLAYTFTIK